MGHGANLKNLFKLVNIEWRPSTNQDPSALGTTSESSVNSSDGKSPTIASRMSWRVTINLNCSILINDQCHMRSRLFKEFQYLKGF